MSTRVKVFAGAVLAAVVVSLTAAAPARAIVPPPMFDNDGAVGWGTNVVGQLGDGTTTMRTAATRVSGMAKGVEQVAAGYRYSLLLKKDGTVWSWGINQFGQLGLGHVNSSLTPQQVPGLTGVVQVATHASHSLALTSSGLVYAWGANGFGMLGVGDIQNRATPTRVFFDQPIKQIAAGDLHSMALGFNGVVYAWGSNRNGQLTGSHPEHRWPAQILHLFTVTQIAAGAEHSMALLADGTLRVWGDNVHGQLGVQPVGTDRPFLVMPDVGGIGRIGAGEYGSFACTGDPVAGTCVNSILFGWGLNHAGQLGTGSTTTVVPIPFAVNWFSQILAVDGGYGHSVLLVRGGDGRTDVLTAGANSGGWLGTGGGGNRSTFGPTLGLKDTFSISTADFHTLAATVIEPVICCG